MKRLLILLCALFLLIPVAHGENANIPEPDVVVLRTEDGVCGMAVSFYAPGLYLSTAPLPDHTETVLADTPKGQVPLTVLEEHEGLRILGDLSDEPYESVPALLGESSGFSAFSYMGVNEAGERKEGKASPLFAVMAGEEIMTLSLGDENLLEGTVILNDNHALSGLVLSSMGTGNGQVLALTGQGIYRLIFGDDEEETAGTLLRPRVEQMDDGTLHIDWKDAAEEKNVSDAPLFFAYVLNENMPYYRFVSIQDGSTDCYANIIPGETYHVYVLAAQEPPAGLPGADPETDMSVIRTVMSDSEADKHYESLSFCVSAAQNPRDEIVLQGMKDFTVSQLNDPEVELYLQVVGRYEVTEESETFMTISLNTPSETTYEIGSVFIYSPDVRDNDAWHIPLTEILDSIRQLENNIPTGTYRLRFFIGNQLIDSLEFTVSP